MHYVNTERVDKDLQSISVIGQKWSFRKRADAPNHLEHNWRSCPDTKLHKFLSNYQDTDIEQCNE